MYKITRFIFRVYWFISTVFRGGMGKYVHGLEHIPEKGPFLIVANHGKDIDPWRIAIEFSKFRIHWWAKKELCHYSLRYEELRKKRVNPIFSMLVAMCTVVVVKYSGVISVDRDYQNASLNKVAIKQTLKVLRNGGVVGIFGYGGKNRTNDAKSIFIKIAQKCNVPIVPVTIDGKHLHIDYVIYPNKLCNYGDSSKKMAEKVMHQIQTCHSV